MRDDSEDAGREREMPSEDEIIADLVERGIARPQYEHERAGQTCLFPDCDEVVPENSHKKMNLGAKSGYCSVVCYMEDEDRRRRERDTDRNHAE